MFDSLLDIFDRDRRGSSSPHSSRRGLRGLLDRFSGDHDDDHHDRDYRRSRRDRDRDDDDEDEMDRSRRSSRRRQHDDAPWDD